ncbi:DNA-binding protein HU-beta [Yoonia maritima]|uniref:DNA-binding protein HU-beta n=1 Tax=Yoonia maritima TaxID=1435347 RepID=A0A2T0W1R6_9RHOB|nr:HU family DNA-binding protein [Yoonia maritima]PRY78895.1 DNA-binding protein HU-beta [Yoonia maritima]
MTTSEEPQGDPIAEVAPTLKKPQLFNEVVARTGLKKRDVKPAVEAALAVIGEALARGDELILPPMGKTRIVKTKDLGQGATLLTLKFRTPKIDTAQPDTDASDS